MVPPEGMTEIVPVEFPKHKAGVEEVVAFSAAAGCVTWIDVTDETQLFASVTVTV